MAYSINKCLEIRDRVDEIGIYETAVEYGINTDSVKRALRYVKGHEEANDELVERRESVHLQEVRILNGR